MLMSTCGIIAEYNPFHTGHAYQIAQAKKQSGADNVIVIMSGDFVQRGAPAIMDKYERAKMAIHAGADLVIMLPVCASTASAEGFALASIAGLHSCGIVDAISFGCEDPAVMGSNFRKLARELNTPTPAFQEVLSAGLRAGKSYASARAQAIQSCYASLLAPDELNLLEKPNNLLAFSYLQAMEQLNCNFSIHPVTRQGMGYHETACESETIYASASACRKLMLSDDVSDHMTLQHLYSKEDFLSLLSYRKSYAFLCKNDASTQLHYALLSGRMEGYRTIMDCGKDLSNRIQNLLPEYEDFEQFAMLLKNKSVSYSRICRLLTHILLQLPDREIYPLIEDSSLPYVRILAMSPAGQKLLGQIKRSGNAPLLMKMSDTGEFSPRALHYFKQDLFAHDIYNSILYSTCRHKLPEDFSRRLSPISFSQND